MPTVQIENANIGRMVKAHHDIEHVGIGLQSTVKSLKRILYKASEGNVYNKIIP